MIPIVLQGFRVVFYILWNLFSKVLLLDKRVTPADFAESKQRQELIFFDDGENTDSPKKSIDFCFFINGFMADSIRRCFPYESILNSIHKQENKSNNIRMHFISSNNGKTFDGIQKGGERVAHEIIDVIKKEVNESMLRNKVITDVTISMFGISLGGIYGRYAISDLYEIFCADLNGGMENFSEMTMDDGKIKVHFNSIHTYMSPHLGISKQTYFPFTKKVENFLANATKQTGLDAFHCNNLFWRMATSQKFLKPLSLFHKRVAYSNAFHTDLMVPTNTAAFLNPFSKYPHFLRDKTEELLEYNTNIIIASVETEKSNMLTDSESNERDMLYMSLCLDSLGWRKVFLDARTITPTYLNFSLKSNKCSTNQWVQNELRCRAQKSKDAYVVESSELCKLLSSRQGSVFNIVPMGHLSMVGLSAFRLMAAFTWEGRPAANYAANLFVKDVISFSESEFGD